MDGLTITNARKLLDSGKTASEISTQKFTDLKNSNDKSNTEFADTFQAAINKVNDLQKDSDVKMQKLATGETTDLSDVMITAEKADIALKLMMSIRNKMIDAYQEIMKMQV